MNKNSKWTAAAAFILVLSWSIAIAQTADTGRVMRQKLAQSQQLLEAVVTSNWGELDRHGRALEALTNQRGWAVLRSPEYMSQTEAFQRAVRAVIDSARMRDQQTALAAYNSLVTSCVECHRQVGRSRIVGPALH